MKRAFGGLSRAPQRSVATLPIKEFTRGMVFICLASSAAQADESTIETIVVTASPLPGAAVDPGLIPTSTQTLTAADISRSGTASLLRALDQSGTGVSLSNAQDNAFQPSLYYRRRDMACCSGSRLPISTPPSRGRADCASRLWRSRMSIRRRSIARCGCVILMDMSS